MKQTFWVLSLLVIITLQTARAAKIKPADVYVQVAVVEEEVELIRRFMGKPKARKSAFRIYNAAPREVYFQALTLLRKTGRMSKEHTGNLFEAPNALPKKIFPFHVLQLIDKTLENVLRVKRALGDNQETVAPMRDATKTPSDVFLAIIRVNQQVNLLLEYVLSPTDVYERVRLATFYASALTGRPIPTVPYVCCKQPPEVFKNLVEAFALIEVMAKKSDVPMLRLESSNKTDVLPEEVYDLAMLVLSELTHFSQLALIPMLDPPDYDGRKFPADVYQQVAILKILLTEKAP